MDPIILWIESTAIADGASLTAILVITLIFATTSLMAVGVPGVIIPATFAASALAGPVAASAFMSAAAMGGSLLLFLAARRWGRSEILARFGNRLKGFERRFVAHGFWYVVGLRAIGTPHVLVTVGSAMMPIQVHTFSLATVVGFLPAIALAATAGSIV